MRKTFLAVLLAGCSATLMVPTVQTRAAFDLSCSKDNLNIIKLGGGSYGVRGCGKQATYVVDGPCGLENDQRCTAELNSEVQPDTANSAVQR